MNVPTGQAWYGSLNLKSLIPVALQIFFQVNSPSFSTKPVNDTYGHPVGDALLQHVSEILLKCCREIDTVARLGGDEFAVILVSTEEKLNTEIPAQRIIEQLSKVVTIEEHSITIGISIGISSYPDSSCTTEELQRQADAALYQAKDEGRNTYRIFHVS